jgi:hypothetical protein
MASSHVLRNWQCATVAAVKIEELERGHPGGVRDLLPNRR